MLLAPTQSGPIVSPDVTGSGPYIYAPVIDTPIDITQNPYPIETPETVTPGITIAPVTSPNQTVPAIAQPQIATKTSNMIYAQGFINDATSKKAIPASIQLIVTATGLPLSGDTPLLLQDGFYSAWSDGTQGDISVKFTAPGYTDKIIPIATLQNSPDVFLDKSTGSAMPLLLGAGLLFVLANKKGKRIGSPEITTGTLVTIGVGFLILKGMGLFNKLLSSLGLGPDPTLNSQSDPNSPWKPNYWQQFTTFPNGAIDETSAKDIATMIYYSLGVFSDDYNSVLRAFSPLKSKANVSFVAWEFQKLFNIDMLSFLSGGDNTFSMPWDGLSSTHLQTLVTLVNNLPSS